MKNLFGGKISASAACRAAARRPAGCRLDGSDQSHRDEPQPGGERPANSTAAVRLLCHQRGRPHPRRPWCRHQGGAQLRGYPGAIPIPATLSLELGPSAERQHNITYGLFPITHSPTARRILLDRFETDALRRLRANPNQVLTANETRCCRSRSPAAPRSWRRPALPATTRIRISKRDWKVATFVTSRK